MGTKRKIMKPFIPISLLTWMCLFGTSKLAHANQSQGITKAVNEEKFVWHTDYEKARKLADSQNKKLFILFTGSDWCPPCRALKSKVLDKAIFQKKAVEDYVFVMADFPNKKKISEAQKAHNERL